MWIHTFFCVFKTAYLRFYHVSYMIICIFLQSTRVENHNWFKRKLCIFWRIYGTNKEQQIEAILDETKVTSDRIEQIFVFSITISQTQKHTHTLSHTHTRTNRNNNEIKEIFEQSRRSSFETIVICGKSKIFLICKKKNTQLR